MKQKKIEKVPAVVKSLKELIANDLKDRITHCPMCGVDVKGPRACASINCACAPKITV